METNSLYEKYLSCVVDIVEQIGKEAASQGEIAQDERKSVSEIEKKYMQMSDELEAARTTIRQQYRSVWESCTQSEGLKRSADLRPVATNLSWKEAVRIQEQAALRIREWFSMKTQQAFAERQLRIREEEARRAAIAAAQAEAARRETEEAARAEKERAAALIEAMKNKYRRNN